MNWLLSLGLKNKNEAAHLHGVQISAHAKKGEGVNQCLRGGCSDTRLLTRVHELALPSPPGVCTQRRPSPPHSPAGGGAEIQGCLPARCPGAEGGKREGLREQPATLPHPALRWCEKPWRAGLSP